jgi:hypothetical protein
MYSHRTMPSTQPHVSDLIVVLGEGPAVDVCAMLAARPGLGGSIVHRIDRVWGTVWVQTTFGAPIDRAEFEEAIFVGRPVVRQGRDALGLSPHEWLRHAGGLDSPPPSRAPESRAPERLSAGLSGMFALFQFDDAGVRVLTDRMGFRPVYVGRDERGEVRSIGTHAETVAAASGTGDRIDAVSVAELLVHNDITFPYTTRETMRELPPASLTTIDAKDRVCSSQVLWEPTEPEVFPAPEAMRARMRDAMLEAGRDLTWGCDRIGVLLSGGADSRAVLGAVLHAVDDPAKITGLTYVTRENNETRVAARVAEAAGCCHQLVLRDEHYFPRMLGRGLALLGCELRGNCHGLGVADRGLADRFDVVIGGQLSDTMLKDHFVDITTRAGLRTPTLKQRARQLIPGLRRPLPVSPPGHTTGRAQLEPILTDDMRRRVRERRSQRLRDVQRIRPQTGAVWHRFWPCSRQDDSAHTLGNTRIMISDTIFAHSAIIEVASDLSLRARLDGVEANAAITDVCGRLASIENANTGLPIDAPSSAIRRAKKARPVRPGTAQAAPEDHAPWNAVQTSWVDPKLMQQRSPDWIRAREKLGQSPALVFLDTIVGRGGNTLVGAYQDDLPSNINHIAVQIALWLDMVLGETSPERQEASQAITPESR